MTLYKHLSSIIIIAIIIISCQNDNTKKNAQQTLFTLMPIAHTGVKFENTLESTHNINIFKYQNFYDGAGVAIGDINNDNLPDIFFVSNQGKNKLYLNKGNFIFEDISKIAQIEGNRFWNTGVSMVDINNDGYLDIYVCSSGGLNGNDQRNELYINNKDLTFKESSSTYLLDENKYTNQAVFFDYDLDGDLDVYMLNNSFVPIATLGRSNERTLEDKQWNVANVLKKGGDRLYQNNLNHEYIQYTDVSEKSGIYSSLIGLGKGVSISDINNDGYPDIYVTNDGYERDYMYINQQDGTFVDEILKRTTLLSQSAKGVDLQDINNDAMIDIFVTDILPKDSLRRQRVKIPSPINDHKLGFHQQKSQNTLQMGTSEGDFEEMSTSKGVSASDWSWGGLIFDMDNDGYKDIYITNGIYKDMHNKKFLKSYNSHHTQRLAISADKKSIRTFLKKIPSHPISNISFQNNKNESFIEKTNEWGLHIDSFSNGVAYGDLDNDGDLDLVVNNINEPAFIYKNNADVLTDNQYLKIKLHGGHKNIGAIGSYTILYTNAGKIRTEFVPVRGYLSSVENVATVGIGHRTIDSLEVHWPDRNVYMVKGIKSNTTIQLEYDVDIPSVSSQKDTLQVSVIKYDK